MTKQNALGSAFLAGIYDISGDIGALTSMETTQAVQEDSGIDVEGTERIGLRLDGQLGYTGWWNPAAHRSVVELSALQAEKQFLYIARGTGIGRYACSLIARKTKFTPTNGADGSLVIAGEAMASGGFPPEWGKLLTIGEQTFAATQAVSAWQALHNYALNDLVQPTVPNGRYYKVTADAGSSAASEPTWPTVTGNTVVDAGITWTDQGLLPNGLDRGVGSASNFGLAAYLHVLSLGSGTANVKLQDSADRISWDDVPAAAFAAITGPVTERVVTAPTENVRRYLRAYVYGTFTNLVAAVNAVVYRQ